MYALLHREGDSYTSREVGRYDSTEVAMAAAGHPQAGDWEDTPYGAADLRGKQFGKGHLVIARGSW